MRHHLNFVAAVMFGTIISAPALAVCEFPDPANTIDLSPGGPVDPYGSDFSRTVTIPIDPDCGTVFLELDTDNQALSTLALESVPVDVTVLNGTIGGGRGRYEISDDAWGIDLRLDVRLSGASRNAPRSGTYSASQNIRLFSSANGTSEIDSALLHKEMDVDEVMLVALTGISGNTIDLGQLVPGETVRNSDATLRTVANAPYQITVNSMKGWRLTLDDITSRTYEIPYSLSIGGRVVTANPGVVSGMDATDESGIGQILAITASPEGNLRAGQYVDEVTITISADPVGF